MPKALPRALFMPDFPAHTVFIFLFFVRLKPGYIHYDQPLFLNSGSIKCFHTDQLIHDIFPDFLKFRWIQPFQVIIQGYIMGQFFVFIVYESRNILNTVLVVKYSRHLLHACNSTDVFYYSYSQKCCVVIRRKPPVSGVLHLVKSFLDLHKNVFVF